MHPSTIQRKIYELRGQKVMLDFDLALLYEVETRVLNQAVRRNIKRFPPDFMFRLGKEEWDNLRTVQSEENSSQIVTSSKNRGQKYLPYAFTEQGVAMLSGILRSDKAVDVNISIMRAFVLLRQYALTHGELTEKLRELEKRYDQKFHDVYEALNYLLQQNQLLPDTSPRKRIGYK